MRNVYVTFHFPAQSYSILQWHHHVTENQINLHFRQKLRSFYTISSFGNIIKIRKHFPNHRTYTFIILNQKNSLWLTEPGNHLIYWNYLCLFFRFCRISKRSTGIHHNSSFSIIFLWNKIDLIVYIRRTIQSYHKIRSFIPLAINTYTSFMQQYNTFHQCKPDTGTDMRLAIRCIYLIETGKNIPDRFRRDANTRIRDDNTEQVIR